MSETWAQDVTRAVNETARQIHLLLSPLIGAADESRREVVDALAELGLMLTLHGPLIVPDRNDPMHDVELTAGRYLIFPIPQSSRDTGEKP